MNPIFRFPPIHKTHLTPSDDIASRLQGLIGTPFKLTNKTRTDGSNMRKLVAQTFAKFLLPKPCPRSSYYIVPPKAKGLPRILLEAFLKLLLLFGFDVGVLTEHLQVSAKNPERKVSDEYAVSISDRYNRRAMAAATSFTALASVALWWSGSPTSRSTFSHQWYSLSG